MHAVRSSYQTVAILGLVQYEKVKGEIIAVLFITHYIMV